MTESSGGGRLPPRWFIRFFWVLHRRFYALTGGRGLRRPTPKDWGMMRLHTVGRQSGKERIAILGYYEDGPNLVTLAMNGWGKPEPAWWLNAQARPETTVDTVDGSKSVRVRAASGEERTRLWARWAEYEGGDNLEAWSSRRDRETAVVVLEPR
jgi:deazaflavin-dependent oxidoreductase (nitroreductase family)